MAITVTSWPRSRAPCSARKGNLPLPAMMPMRATEGGTLLGVRDLDGVSSGLAGRDIALVSDPHAERAGAGHRAGQESTARRGRILQHHAARRAGPGAEREADHQSVVC